MGSNGDTAAIASESTPAMDYQRYFAEAISGLKTEGRYRVFADLERRAGDFPRAKRHGPDGVEQVTV